MKRAIVHCLIVREGTRLADIRKVYSHPQGLQQCDRFLRTLSDVEIIATYDTAGSAKMIKEQGLTDSAGHRVGARSGRLRPDRDPDRDPGRGGQLHALPGHRP